MNLFYFINRFPQENDCLEYFIAIREKYGVICKKCGHHKHKFLAGKDQFECEQCENRISIKSGTIMENSKLPIKYWFITMYLLTSSKKTFLASELQKKLGYPEYEPVCEMLHNLHLVMDNGDDEYRFERLLLACTKDQIVYSESCPDY